MNNGITVIGTAAEAHWSGEDVPETVEHPETGETVASMRYVSTDAWRGYWEADSADGWTKVGEGTNTGGWDDAPSGTSNDEVEAEINRLQEEHGEIVVVLGGSSNVFSQPYDVFARVARVEPDTDDEAPQRRQSDDPEYDEAEQQEAERGAA